MQIKKMSRIDSERMNAYGHGYALGRSGFDFDTNCLWHEGEKAYPFELYGYNDGLDDYLMFGELDGDMVDLDNIELVENK